MQLWLLVAAALVIVSGEILYCLMREVERIRELSARREATAPQEPMQFLLGTSLPRFSAVATDGTQVTDAEIRGLSSILFFISPAEISKMNEEALRSTLFGLWAQADGCLYVVSGANCEVSKRISDNWELERIYKGEVKVVVDAESKLRGLFRVTDGPCAIVLDEVGNIHKVGRPDSQFVLSGQVGSRFDSQIT
jgi:hypothetical protein